MSEMPERIWAYRWGIDGASTSWNETKPFGVYTGEATQYIRADIAALSSAAVAEREPRGWICEGCSRFSADPEEDLKRLRLGGHLSCCPERKISPLYLDPPPASELEAENARLRAELEYQKKVSADRWETTERQAYAFDDMRIRAEAAEARLAEAMKAPRLTDEMIRGACKAHFGTDNADGVCVTVRDQDWTFRQAFKRMWKGALAARRVREGGKVE